MNILYLIILLGSLQGLTTGLLLFFLPLNKIPNRLLATLLFLIALAGLNLYLDDTGWYYSSTPIAIFHALVPMVLLMPLGPLILFYIKSSIDPSFSLGKKDRRHFLPVIIDILPQITALVFFGCNLAGIFLISTRSLGKVIDEYNVYSDIPRWLSLSIYLFASAKALKSIDTNGKATNKVQLEKLKWLKRFVRTFLIFQLIWLPYLAIYIMPSYTNVLLEKLHWFPVYVPLSILIYYVGLKGYIVSYTRILNEKRAKDIITTEVPPSVITTILKSMEEDKLYLNPMMDLPTLARHTALSTKTISVALNQHFKKNFNDFINSYRIMECQARITDPASNHLTIVGIAAECGFNSSSTFQRVFKQITGLSPSEYRKAGKNDQPASSKHD